MFYQIKYLFYLFKEKGKNILSYGWHDLLIAFYLIDLSFIFYFVDASIWHHFLYYC